ncbi:ras family-domain-containing protein [Russula vinacea]|nr:ras family-domain-containing protein [Russula vinacea]
MDCWRVAVLGDGGVGKTALAVQFTLNCFVEDAYRKQLVVDNRMCFVEVIDTAGKVEEYATLRDQWVREGQGFILVYSIASRATFERLEVFRQSMLRVKRQKPIFMLVGNKADKQLEREVTREEGMQLAREFGCEFLETSAKTARMWNGSSQTWFAISEESGLALSPETIDTILSFLFLPLL